MGRRSGCATSYLGIESHDIDIAINSMTGRIFALRLVAFCDEEINKTTYSLGPDDLKHLHTVKKNPDRSKHLETATTTLFGLDLDFVDLRKETYAADKPESADRVWLLPRKMLERRDATVNALFYNLAERRDRGLYRWAARHAGKIDSDTSGAATDIHG